VLEEAAKQPLERARELETERDREREREREREEKEKRGRVRRKEGERGSQILPVIRDTGGLHMCVVLVHGVSGVTRVIMVCVRAC
jgi:hypothetical protein